MNLALFSDQLIIKGIPRPDEKEQIFKWEIRKTLLTPSDLNVNKAVGCAREYVPQPKDKLFFFPGCDVPRYKVRDWGTKNDATITVAENKATAKFASPDSIMECLTVNHSPEIPKATFLSWLNTNYNLGDGNIAEIYKEVDESANNFVYLSRPLSGYNSRTFTGQYNNGNYKNMGYKKSLLDIDPNFDCRKHMITVESKRWSDLTSLVTDPDIYSQETIIGTINKSAAIIDETMYNSIRTMFKSPNTADKLLAMEIIANCNINPSLHFVLIIMKEFHNDILNMKESKHVNFKSLLEYVGMTRSKMINISDDDMITYLLDKEVLTMQTVTELATAVKQSWVENHSSKHFKISKITVSDEVKDYFKKQQLKTQLQTN